MSDEDAVPTLVRQGELTDQIAALLPTRVTGPWTSLVFYNRSLSSLGEDELVVTRPDGSTDASQAAPFEVSKLLVTLRKVMYRPGAGTWLSVEWHITNHGDSLSSRAKFNYDEEPAWWDPIDPAYYGLDLEAFPRTEEATPEWLRLKVLEAEANARQ